MKKGLRLAKVVFIDSLHQKAVRNGDLMKKGLRHLLSGLLIRPESGKVRNRDLMNKGLRQSYECRLAIVQLDFYVRNRDLIKKGLRPIPIGSIKDSGHMVVRNGDLIKKGLRLNSSIISIFKIFFGDK